MKRIAILGSTGSIGTQALDIINRFHEYYKVKVLTTNENIDLLEEQIIRFNPEYAVVVNENKARELNNRNHTNTRILSGKKALVDVAAMDDLDMVLTAVVGIAGLKATMSAVNKGLDVALANKETLVAGGKVVTDAALRSGSRLIPVDSEHSAIFQCLQGNMDERQVKRIILTASGGPFLGYDLNSLKDVTLDDALKHPNWDMGRKVTIDSATLMNKGLEVIEAKWLFNMDAESIDVVVHPQSIIHSAVEYIDGSVIAQMGIPDMRIPIHYAFSYPQRRQSMTEPLDFFNMGPLTFQKPDTQLFPCLAMAYRALEIGGTMPVVLNAANEVAVDKFIKREIDFLDIPALVEKAMESHNIIEDPSIDVILGIDWETRQLLK